MARTVQEIQNEIIAVIKADENLSTQLTSTSKTAIWRLFTYVVAFSINILERMFDALRIETNDRIALLKPHTLRWYAQKARAFQHGFDLLPDSDQFDNSGYTDQQIEDSQIVSYAAVVEQIAPSGRTVLRVKVAKSDGENLTALSAPELDAFKEYMSRVKDAGVVLKIDSLPADKIKQVWKIYYDPLLLTAAGDRVDGTENEPVRTAIKEYLKNLPFNGTFVNTYHIDAVQLVDGVVNAVLEESYATYGNIPLSAIAVEYQPDSGYLSFQSEEDLTIQYIPRGAIQ